MRKTRIAVVIILLTLLGLSTFLSACSETQNKPASEEDYGGGGVGGYAGTGGVGGSGR
ncbi:hypothetical protein [Legionella brunensis]|uniref:Uncharacterized protein n=1 Tax=Legionella brunensis TaxID=29422 RepID=A0A0W0S397_9GAMM|nr:hypothetical protein [Legionella brunensis]KTC77999.1 hypothetical protein Lbru_2291 [Legionella brunensis]